MRRISCRTLVALGAMTLAPWASSTAAAQRTAPIIVDHRATNLSAIPTTPTDWIAEAKARLHIAYGHTSHGSQLTDGMTGLAEWKGDRYAWNRGGLDGALDLDDGGSGELPNDVGYYSDWYDATLSFLGAVDPSTGRGSSHPDVNVIIWSWCGQAAERTEETMLSTYLTPMSQLEAAYPGVTFVYMTGHLDGSGAEGNLNLRNQQIRDYVVANNKVLYDFADIESYDPDGLVNYMELLANDNCDYDSDGNGSRESNWCTDWQDSHTEGVDWYNVSAAHSQALNGNRKAYAAWWLWARLAGWSDEERLRMDDASAPEGDEASAPSPAVSAPPAPAVMTPVSFQATLSAQSDVPVTVNFTTIAGTATADVDYTSLSGTITFAPGETTKQVTIQIIGDLIDEPDETFSVVLSNPVNATIDKGEGIGTIVDDDEPPPVVTAAIADTSVTEGDSGPTPAEFTVTLSGPATQEVRIDYVTSNGTATAGDDYTSESGTLIIQQGDSSGTISVDVMGDTTVEPNETFTVTLSNPDGATILDGTAIGTILDDDTPVGEEVPVVWTRVVGATASVGALTRTASGSTWGTSGAISALAITEGDGYVEFSAATAPVKLTAGLGNGDTNASYTDIDFGIMLNTDSKVYIYENGTARGSSRGTYVSGDTFRVAIEGGVVRYYQNLSLLYESALSPAYPLGLDASINTAAGSFDGAVIAGDSLARPIEFAHPVGASAGFGVLTRTATGSSWGGAGAVSTVAIASGDGYVEFQATPSPVAVAAGLGNGDTNASYTDINFGLMLYTDGKIYVYENGQVRGGSKGTYVAGDRFRVSVEGGAVSYFQNDSLLYESLVTPTYPLVFDSSINTAAGSITQALIGGTNLVAAWPDPPSQAVSWAHVLGAAPSSGTLTRTGTGSSWGATGGVSTLAIASGDGFVEFQASPVPISVIAGLGTGDTNQSYADIDFGIMLYSDSKIYVYESGAVRGASKGTYVAGDRFRVSVEYGIVRYLKNDVVIYQSLLTPTYPLVFDCAIHTAGGAITQARIGGTNLTEAWPDPPSQAAEWTNVVGANASTGTLTSTAASSWGASGATSTLAIISGDGFVEFNATPAPVALVAGLGNGNTSASYTDIDYGIMLFTDSKVYVYQNGALIGGSRGTYVAGDTFRIAIEDGAVRYYKNGLMLYQSLVAPTYPLAFDTSLKTTGSSITNAVIAGDDLM